MGALTWGSPTMLGPLLAAGRPLIRKHYSPSVSSFVVSALDCLLGLPAKFWFPAEEADFSSYHHHTSYFTRQNLLSFRPCSFPQREAAKGSTHREGNTIGPRSPEYSGN